MSAAKRGTPKPSTDGVWPVLANRNSVNGTTAPSPRYSAMPRIMLVRGCPWTNDGNRLTSATPSAFWTSGTIALPTAGIRNTASTQRASQTRSRRVGSVRRGSSRSGSNRCAVGTADHTQNCQPGGGSGHSGGGLHPWGGVQPGGGGGHPGGTRHSQPEPAGGGASTVRGYDGRFNGPYRSNIATGLDGGDDT